MKNFLKAYSETISDVNENFAAEKAKEVSDLIQERAPELTEEWGNFVNKMNPNSNDNLFEFTKKELFDPTSVEKNGLDTKEAFDKVVAESPNYNRYRYASEATSTFFKDLINQGVDSEKIKGFMKTFGSDSFPENVEKLAETLGVSVQELPDSSVSMYENLHHVDLTLKRAEQLGKDVKPNVAEPVMDVPIVTETPQGEAVAEQGNWLEEDISYEAKEKLKNKGYESLTKDLTPEEKVLEENYKNSINEYLKEKEEKEPSYSKIIKEVLDGEGNVAKEAKEATKLLLRLAVKAGVGLAVSIAKNIAKDKDTPQELRIMMGVFADGLQNAGSFADKALAGKEKADLEKDIFDFITDKYN